MKHLILAILFSLGATTHAQMSVQESDSSNRFSLLGRNVNFNFFSLATMETDKIREEGGRLSTYNFLTASTYVDMDYRLSLRLPFQYNTAGTDRFNGARVNKDEMFLQDVILSLQNYNLAYMPYDFEIYWEGRLYLPTSENSDRMGLIARVRNNFILSRYLNHFLAFEYDQKFNYYFQSRSAYSNSFQDEDGFDVTVTSLTKRTLFENGIRLWARLAPEVGAGWSIGTQDTSYNRSAALNKSKPDERMMRTGPQFRFPITTRANFILSYEDVVNRDLNPRELGRFLAKNTQLSLFSFFRF